MSCPLQAGDGIVETTLSLMTSVENYLTVRMRNVRPLYGHYSRPYVREWRFRRHCVQQSALGNIPNELLHGREDVVTSVVKSVMGLKPLSENAEVGPFPPLLD